jgi:hypothetical protein
MWFSPGVAEACFAALSVEVITPERRTMLVETFMFACDPEEGYFPESGPLSCKPDPMLFLRRAP